MRIYIFIIILIIPFVSFSQNIRQNIRGTVIDKHSKMPLIGANVMLLNTDPPIGTVTDIEGKFRLDSIKIGRIGLNISYMGYNTIVLNNLNLSPGKELLLNFEMEEKIFKGKEFEVVANNEKDKAINQMATVSARTFSVEESQRYAGSMNDVARMASNFAGAQSNNDTRNDIIIRGNAPTGVLYRLEGIDIPNPNHFASFGTTGGPISILNNNVLANSDFFTGAFPAEYGNALAGVFDLKMRTGNNERREFVGQAGFNGFELLAEGPLSKKHKASYLASYRYSNFEFLKLIGVDFGTAAIPEYQDVSFKINYPHKFGSTSIFGIGGMSQIELLSSDVDTSQGVVGNYGENIYFKSSVGVVGISHTQIINPKTYVKAIASVSGYANRINDDSISVKTLEPVPEGRKNIENGKISAHVYLNTKITAQHIVKTGILYDHFFFSISDSMYVSYLDGFVSTTDFNGESDLIHPYFQWQFRATDNVTFNIGLHYQYFALSKSSSLEPRAGMKFQLNEKQSINLGYGLHSQMQPLPIYFEQIQLADNSFLRPNKNLNFTKAHHFVIGYDRTLGDNLRLKAEAYYQKLFDAPIDVNKNAYSMLNEGADFGINFPDTLENKGTGRNYGVEFTVEQFLHNGLYFLVTNSLYQSLYKGSDGVERSTGFNGNYVLNILGGKEWVIRNKKADKNKFQHIIYADGKFAYIGGRPYTPIDLQASKNAGYTVYDESKPFTERFDDYIRFDFRFGYKLNGKVTSQELAVYLQNVTNRKNVFGQSYNATTGKIENTYQLGFLPVVQYRIEF
ncbi:MAG: TonB-dependent receptor [Flavobacteriales bacterium]|nr:MAG: TonB-dependent receptor [Flavobacteriales bacterium]